MERNEKCNSSARCFYLTGERKQLEGLKVIWLRKLSVFLLEQNTELSKLSSVKN